MALNNIITASDFKLLDTIAQISDVPNCAFNIRKNGEGVARGESENIKITTKKDVSGIDIRIAPGTKGEKVYIPVIITETDLTETVYNDFYVGENADVVIIAGCGIHNDGACASRHDGVHTFHLEKGAKVKYEEKHYAEGVGDRIMNPITVINVGKDASFEMDTEQIKGVTSTLRKTTAYLAENARMNILEKLVTHDGYTALSDIDVYLNGEGSSLQIVSRSVARDDSSQKFHPRAIGNAKCSAHVQCDSIIMDNAKVASIPEIAANSADAEIVHEAAIGRINNEQLLKLMTLGLTPTEAEDVIIEGFLS